MKGVSSLHMDIVHSYYTGQATPVSISKSTAINPPRPLGKLRKSIHSGFLSCRFHWLYAESKKTKKLLKKLLFASDSKSQEFNL